jgi:hypothetical protein
LKIGVIPSLNLPESRYNKNIKYIDLIADKPVTLEIDPYYNYYSRNCYDRCANTTLYKNLVAYVENNVLTAGSTITLPVTAFFDVTSPSFGSQTKFKFTNGSKTISGFYKDILVNLENILKNHGYTMKYY